MVMFEVLAPTGRSRVVKWPHSFNEAGRLVCFDVGELVSVEDLQPGTNFDALVAGGHLRPVSDADGSEDPADDEGAN